MPPAVVPPPTILCRLRSEKAYCGAGGRGFDSRHLHDEYRPLTRDFSLIGGLFRAKRHKKDTRGFVLWQSDGSISSKSWPVGR